MIPTALTTTDRALTTTDVMMAFGASLRLYVADGDASPETIRSYHSNAAQFVAWCREHGIDPATATGDDIAAYRQDLVGRYEVRTVAVKLAAIRRLYEAAVWHRLRADNPVGSGYILTGGALRIVVVDEQLQRQLVEDIGFGKRQGLTHEPRQSLPQRVDPSLYMRRFAALLAYALVGFSGEYVVISFPEVAVGATLLVLLHSIDTTLSFLLPVLYWKPLNQINSQPLSPHDRQYILAMQCSPTIYFNCLTERSKYGIICLIFDQISNWFLLTTVISPVPNKPLNFLPPPPHI